ncbi:MAG: hypothetical protein U5K43_03145 [Halofilum sp. (in: g-proteobacteria)]|nr:hypothetical protein [Halofilum sp. (in: g-proteobacteria)]
MRTWAPSSPASGADARPRRTRAALGNAHGATGRVAECYTPKARDRVRALYARDFAAFGYDDALEL